MFEGKNNPEVHFEADKNRFEQAVENTVIQEINFSMEEGDRASFSLQVDGAGIFLLGEMHGSKENVDIAYTLCKRFRFDTLALEWDKELEPVIDTFLETGSIDFASIKGQSDGRVTAEHFALFKKLKDEGLLRRIICFDSKGAWRAVSRDVVMARNLLDSLNQDENLTIVIAGNRHTEVESFTRRGDTEMQHPMGEYVKKEIPNIPSGRIRYGKGSFYNNGPRVLSGINSFENAAFVLLENGTYEFRLPESHLSTVPHTENR